MKTIYFIIVSYRDTKEVMRLLGEIKKQKLTETQKIVNIVVDNSYAEVNKKRITAKFPETIYLSNPQNYGFAKAVNRGLRLSLHKKADFVCLVNPDVKIPVDFIAELLKRKIEITGPVLTYQKNGKKIYDLGGMIDWRWGRTKHFEINKTSNLQLKTNDIDFLSGCCLFVKTKVFEKTGLFDERYFMYFEDVDWQARAKNLGFRVKQNRNLIVAHYLKGQQEQVFKPFSNIFYNLFSNLKFVFKFQKSVALLLSLVYLLILFIKIILNYVLFLMKKNYAVLFILFAGIFFRTYLIDKTFIFTHESGRDYLAAQTIISTHNFMVTGPPSSHVWLFHGPLYYYLLSAVLAVSNNNIYSGFFLSLFFGISSIAILYYLTAKLFNKSVALISLLLLIFSPAQIYLDRSPFHYSSVGYFTILAAFMIYKLLHNKQKTIAMVSGILIGCAVQLHLTAVLLYFFTNIKLFFAKQYKSLLIVNLFFLLMILPLVMVDLQNNFAMLWKLLLWFPYRIINHSIWKMLLLMPLLLIIIKIYRRFSGNLPRSFFISFALFGLLGLWLHGQTPVHYYYFLVPVIAIIIASIAADIYSKNGNFVKAFLLFVLFAYVTVCSYNYYVIFLPGRLKSQSYPPALNIQKETVKYINNDSASKQLALNRVGLLDQFDGYLDNYKYLLKQVGGRINKKAATGYVIFEDETLMQDYLFKNYDRVLGITKIGPNNVIKIINK